MSPFTIRNGARDMTKFAARRLLLAQCVSNLFIDMLCFAAMAAKGLYRVSGANVVMDVILLVMATEHDESAPRPQFEAAAHFNIELLVARGIELTCAFAGQHAGLLAAIESKTEKPSGPDFFTCVALFLALYVAVDFVAYKYARVSASSPEFMTHNQSRTVSACAHIATQAAAVAVDSLVRGVRDVHWAESTLRIVAFCAIAPMCGTWATFPRLHMRADSSADPRRQVLLMATCALTGGVQAGLVAFSAATRGVQAALADIFLLAYLVVLIGAENVLLLRPRTMFGKVKTQARPSAAAFYRGAANMYNATKGQVTRTMGAATAVHQRLPRFTGERFAQALRAKYSTNPHL